MRGRYQVGLEFSGSCSKVYAHRSRQASSISTSQSRYCQLRLPSRCSCQSRRTTLGSSNAASRNRFSFSKVSAQSRNGPRSHSPKRNAKSHFRPFDKCRAEHAGTALAARSTLWCGFGSWLCAAAATKIPRPGDRAGNARFQGDRHAGAIDLGQDVIRQIGDKVEKLHARQGSGNSCARFSSLMMLGGSCAHNAIFGRFPMADQPAIESRRKYRA